MSENIVGNLIEMNVHMVKTKWGSNLTILGVVLLILVLSLWISLVKEERSWKSIIYFIIPIAISLVLIFIGVKDPRVKEIRLCANGPVSIEQLAVRYDIVKVDGKEIVVREK